MNEIRHVLRPGLFLARVQDPHHSHELALDIGDMVHYRIVEYMATRVSEWGCPTEVLVKLEVLPTK